MMSYPSTHPTSALSFSINETLQIAETQKNILWCVLANLGWHALFWVGSGAVAEDASAEALFGAVVVLSALVLLVFQSVFTYRLAMLMRSRWPWLWIPPLLIASLPVLLVLMNRATGAIRSAGFRVGLMGANLAEIRAAAQNPATHH